jgi:PAS domain S-box-containing protein
MSITHILLVEDDFPVAESIQASLRSLGYMVPMIAQSREEALRQVAETFPDLVLMDIHLEHEMEGIEAAEQIRACFDIPVIYLTAHDDEEILQRARITEPFGYLLKPFNLRELHSTIEIALYKHETEKKLKESEAHFRSIVQDQIELIWRYLPDGTLTFVNEACCWYFGQEPEELLGQSFFRFIPDEDQQEVRNRIASLQRGNPVVETEHRIILSEHTIRWHHWTNRIIWDDQGRVIEYQGTGQDITERKQMEEELRRYRERLEELVEERTAELSNTNKQLQWEIVERKQVEQTLAEEHNLLQTLLYNLPDYIYVKDRESRFLLANKASMHGLGVTTLDELVGKTDFDFFPAELSEQYSADERAIFESGQPLINREEQNINLTTGVTNWLLTTKVPFRDIQGNISGIVGIGRNITERKQVEEALQESQRRYELASTAGQVGVWDWDLKTNEIYIDPNLKAMLGYADHEIRNHLDDWGKLVHPDDAKEVTAKATAHLEGRTSEYEVVHRMLHKDGSIRWFLARGTAIRDENGIAYRMVGTDSDITDRKQMEEALQESEERFRAIFETAQDAIFIKDRTLRYT